MPSVENTYALISLERAKQHAKILTDEHDTELTMLINEVSARAERFMGRHWLSRQYVHDGSTLPRLTTRGGTVLVLPEAPVTAVSSLKVNEDATALTKGWDQDFTVDAESGVLRLISGYSFEGSIDYPAQEALEITYTAGYTASPTESEGWYWGASVAGAEIQTAIASQVAWAFHQKDRIREGVSSVSTEGSTVTYLTSEWLPEVEEVLTAHRRISRCL